MASRESKIETSAGVDALIGKLRDDGVEKGQREAERILQDAQKRADWLLRQAREESERLLSRARKESEELRRSGLEELQVAARDAALTLQDRLRQNFAEEVSGLVSDSLLDKQVLLNLLQVVVAEACRHAGVQLDGEVEITLPQDLTIDEEELNQCVLGVSHDLFARGVSLSLLKQGGAGLRIHLQESGMQIDLSEETLCSLLLEHLQPKFRDLLQGVFRG